jgi:hypothetical protein
MSTERLFPDDDTDVEPKEHDLEGLDPEVQKERMKEWFFAHYTNPLDNSPYNDGYVFIWGGPYDARRILNQEYEGTVPDEVIEELADELDEITVDWTGNPDEQTMDDYEFDASSSTVHRQTFDAAILTVELLLATEMSPLLQQAFLRLLFANTITALETYLFDFFFSAITADKDLFRKFIEENHAFKKQQISLSNILKQHEKIDQTVRESLLEISWHNLARVKPLYEEILGIVFDEKMMSEILIAVVTRHDIVHRNGRSKKTGIDLTVTKEQVAQLAVLVQRFVKKIEEDWTNLLMPKTEFDM